MLRPLPRSPWIACPRSAPGATLRLWCLSFAGGGAAVWFPWAQELAGIADIVAVRLPGRETRVAEKPLTRVDAMVAALLPILRPHADEDYMLCGHSLGGLLAFEVARALHAAGLPAPCGLVIAGLRAPHHPPDQPLVHPLPDDALLAEVERRYGAFPAEVRANPDLLSLLLPVLRADLEAYETYRHVAGAPLSAPLLALGGAQDANVTREQLADWARYTDADFESGIVPGGHFFLQENRAAVAPLVREFLRRRRSAFRVPG